VKAYPANYRDLEPGTGDVTQDGQNESTQELLVFVTSDGDLQRKGEEREQSQGH